MLVVGQPSCIRIEYNLWEIFPCSTDWWNVQHFSITGAHSIATNLALLRKKERKRYPSFNHCKVQELGQVMLM